MLAVGLNILLLSFIYFEINFFTFEPVFGFTDDLPSPLFAPNKNIAHLLGFILINVDHLAENPLLVSSDITWALSADCYEAIWTFLWTLFTWNEIEIAYKTFKNIGWLTTYYVLHTNTFEISSSILTHPDLSNEDDRIHLDTQFCQMIVFNLQFLEILEIIFWKKITNFFICNTMFFIVITLTILSIAKSTNLIYTLLSFLVFAVTCGLLILYWGNEYIGLCVLLIYGAAIPVLALYIIMLVNVDLIQWLFYVESLKKFSLFNQITIVLTSFFLASLVFILYRNDINSIFNQKNYFQMLLHHHIFYLNMSRWYFNTIDIGYGTDNALELPLNFYNSDLDKVASAAFKLSTNELFALVLLLLVAMVVVISISRPSTISDITPNEPFFINWTIFNALLRHNSYFEHLTFRLRSIMLCLLMIYKRKELPEELEKLEELEYSEESEDEIPVYTLDLWYYKTINMFYKIQDLGTYEYWLFPFLSQIAHHWEFDNHLLSLKLDWEVLFIEYTKFLEDPENYVDYGLYYTSNDEQEQQKVLDFFDNFRFMTNTHL